MTNRYGLELFRKEVYYYYHNARCGKVPVHLTIDVRDYELLLVCKRIQEGMITDDLKYTSELYETITDHIRAYDRYAQSHLRNSKLVFWMSKGYYNNNGAIVIEDAIAIAPYRGQQNINRMYISNQYKEEILTTLFKERVLGL